MLLRALAIALVVLPLLAAPASAGPGSDPVGAARQAGVDMALAKVYEHAPTRRVGFEDENRTVFVYFADSGQRIAQAPTLPPVYLHGNGTDHVRLSAPAGEAFVLIDGGAPTRAGIDADGAEATLCLDDAADGLVQGLGRGLRCNGDLDGDGRGDFFELADETSPIEDDP